MAPMTLAMTMAPSNRSFLSSLAFMPSHRCCRRTCAIKGAASSGALIERLAQGDIALLLRGPVAAAGDGAVDHQIVAVDETGFVAGEKHRGVSNVLGQPGARNRLRGFVDLAHHVGRLLRRF